MKSRKLIGIAVLALASSAALFALVPSIAHAGVASQMNVTIDFEEKIAEGIMKTARFSSNQDELIGCGVRYYLNEDLVIDFSWAFCQARLSYEPGIYVSCYTENPELIDKIAALNSYTYVVFQWNDNGDCTHFGFSTQSMHIPEKVGEKPKKPKK